MKYLNDIIVFILLLSRQLKCFITLLVLGSMSIPNTSLLFPFTVADCKQLVKKSKSQLHSPHNSSYVVTVD